MYTCISTHLNTTTRKTMHRGDKIDDRTYLLLSELDKNHFRKESGYNSSMIYSSPISNEPSYDTSSYTSYDSGNSDNSSSSSNDSSFDFGGGDFGGGGGGGDY